MNEQKKKNDRIITFLGAFADKNLEKEYLNMRIENTKKHIKPIILIFGILYFLFIIPDCFFVTNPDDFLVILFNRIIFIILAMIFYHQIKTTKNNHTIIYWTTAYEIAGSIFFLRAFYHYEESNFLIQTFGIIVLIISIFIIPNLLINKNIVSFVICLTFFSLSLYYIEDIKILELLAAIVYTIIVIILSSFSSYRSGYLQRMDYINNKKLQQIAITDSLTGLYNRLKFDEELNKWVKYSKRSHTDLSLVICDFDNFKQINDKYGHLIGDHVIVDAVRLMHGLIRETDVFARWGGEEFVILLPNTDKQDATVLAERLRVVIEEYPFNEVGSLTCSFGVATLKSEDNTESFLHRADLMLYRAKQVGKNVVKS